MAAEDHVVAEPAQQGAERGQLKDGRHFIERRLAQQELVAIVEPGDLRRQPQDRDRDGAVPGDIGGSRDPGRPRKRNDQRRCIADGQREAEGGISWPTRMWTPDFGQAPRRQTSERHDLGRSQARRMRRRPRPDICPVAVASLGARVSRHAASRQFARYSQLLVQRPPSLQR